MTNYDASAAVGGQGKVRVAGVPFEPGTRVDVTITPSDGGPGATHSEGQERAADLLAALDAARNEQPIGTLRRAGLYDRDCFVETNVLLYAASNAPADHVASEAGLDTFRAPCQDSTHDWKRRRPSS
jgi:hypothetical protein